MGSFRLLEHTADIGFEACGETLQEMFEMAASALMSLMVDLSTVEEREERRIKVDANDREQLLVRFLSELLFLFDAEGFTTCRARVQTMNDHALEVVVKGEKFSETKHEPRLYVKAITYHQLTIQKTSNGFCARVFVDV